MTNVPDQRQRDRLLDILSFWHKLEFFNTFDLEGRIRGEDKRAIPLRDRSLREDLKMLASYRPPDGMRVVSMTLFAAIFDV